jgi:hypothetical protein
MHLEPSHARGLRLVSLALGVAGLGTSGLMVAAAHAAAEIPQYVAALSPAVIGAILVTLVALQRQRIRLRLTDEGLEYHAFGAAVRASWDDIVALTHVEHGPFAGFGVTLHRAVVMPASWAARCWRLIGVRAPSNAIPLSPFAGRNRGSWLEMELRRRVPSLQDLQT